MALGWLAIELTNSPGFVGIVTFAAGVPFIIVAPLGGALIDRTDRQKLMLVCQALAVVLACVMAFDVIGGFVQPWHLPIAAVLNGSCFVNRFNAPSAIRKSSPSKIAASAFLAAISMRPSASCV